MHLLPLPHSSPSAQQVPLHSAYVQLTTQLLPLQVTVPFAGASHFWQESPQLLMSFGTQLLPHMCPLTQPAWQVPPTQLAMPPLGAVHSLPHTPQF